jgi:NADPH-dependent curcumin reductase CurA
MHFDAALASLKQYGRIAVCGGIAEYNKETPDLHLFNPMQMVYSFQRIEGFVCSPWLSGSKGNFLHDMHEMLRSGKIVVQESFFDGIENWPVGFQSLFTGQHLGKVVVRL